MAKKGRKTNKERMDKISIEVAEDIHNSWLNKKKEAGYKSPLEFDKNWKPNYNELLKATNLPEQCEGKCHQDMIPFSELHPKIQEFDIETGKTALNALAKKGYRITKIKKKTTGSKK